jgi:Xaa-Pro aminopeptidase
MPLDVAGIQRYLAADGLDGWLLYDFRGANAIAVRLAGLASGQKMLTRRWYYLIPAQGRPRALVHAIERTNFVDLPGSLDVYATREQLDRGLTALLDGVRRIAMEYSPECAIPYVSRLDAGTFEAIRRRGVEIVSSGDLVQRFEARWDEAALESHEEASRGLYRIKDRTFEELARRTRGGIETNEYDVQQLMLDWFRDEGLVSDAPPVVAVRENAGNPHYLPGRDSARRIDAEQIVLLDLWGKCDRPGAVYADITWMGYTGRDVPEVFRRAFAAVVAARDTAANLVIDSVSRSRELRGWEVDRAARETLAAAGYQAQILHRTGHSLGHDVHGNGANMDDYETHDDRRVLSGTGFTIEPGVYFDTFGVRSEINMYVGDREAQVTGPRQQEIVALH